MKRNGAADPTLGGSYRNLQVLLHVLLPRIAAAASLVPCRAAQTSLIQHVVATMS